MFRIYLAVALLLPLQACASATDSNPIAGDWIFSMSSPFGTVNADVVLVTTGATLTGSFDLGNGRVWPIENGTVAGTRIAFSIDRDGSPMVYQMSATIEGDTAVGVARAMGTEASWTMTRNSQ